jgi:hypothetical protein
MILRARLSVPEDEMFNGTRMLLGDILVNGTRLRYGGQVAEAITMGLFVITVPGGPHANVHPCQFKCCDDPQHPDHETTVDIGSTCPQTHPFRMMLPTASISRMQHRVKTLTTRGPYKK